MTYLNDAGYNVVRLPRRGIVPLGVIGRDGNARNWLGTLDQIWSSPVAAPPPGPPQPVATLTGTRTSDIKLSLGLDILANALSGMFGTTAPGLNDSYRNATSLQFAFKDVRSVAIDPFAIGEFLAQGEVRPNPFVTRYFSGEKHADAMVITEVLEAKSIGVIAKKEAGNEVDVNVPELKGTLGAKVNVTTASGGGSEVVFEGPEYLAFGYKAFGIVRADGQWQVRGLAPDAGHAFAPGAGATPVVEPGELVELAFELPTGQQDGI